MASKVLKVVETNREEGGGVGKKGKRASLGNVEKHDGGRGAVEPSKGKGMSLADKQQFNNYIRAAKRLRQGFEFDNSLHCYLMAQRIHNSTNLEKKILEVRAELEEAERAGTLVKWKKSSTEGYSRAKCGGEKVYRLDPVDVGDAVLPPQFQFGLRMDASIYSNLCAHQRRGILWMWEVHCQSQRIVEEDDIFSDGDSDVDLAAEVSKSQSLEDSSSNCQDLWRGCGNGEGGCILGDDMGLGKTVQVLGFLRSMLQQGLVERVLLAVPTTALKQWQEECGKWMARTEKGPGGQRKVVGSVMAEGALQVYHGAVKARERAIRRVRKDGGICLTTHGTLKLNVAELCPDGYCWDYTVVDEGHVIKNPGTQCSRALHSIRSRQRLLMTGTPIQNKLMEMWALLDWACHGRLLGQRSAFQRNFEEPIMAGLRRDASSQEVNDHIALTETLKKIIAPYFLRRIKEEVFPRGHEGGAPAQAAAPSTPKAAGALGRLEGAAMSPASPQTPNIGIHGSKSDLVVWVAPAASTLRIYEAFLKTDVVYGVLNKTRAAFTAIGVLRALVSHPLLLHRKIQMLQELLHQGDCDPQGIGHFLRDVLPTTAADDDDDEEEEEALAFDGLPDHSMGAEGKAAAIVGEDCEQGGGEEEEEVVAAAGDKVPRTLLEALPSIGHRTLLEHSAKLQLLLPLLLQLRQEGHRTLVFCQRRKMLDIIQHLLEHPPLPPGEGAEGEAEAESGSSYEAFNLRRMDGSIKVKERQRMVDDFQGDDSISVMLLTTMVGGVGLTLTGADRVVIFDPYWNGLDDQAVDRAYRIGQEKDVVVYRLMTSGTIEEKMYRRQVYKSALTKSILGDKPQQRYFSDQELRELFSIGETSFSVTQRMLAAFLEAVDGEESDPALKQHLRYLHDDFPGVVCGVSRHDRLFTTHDDRAVAFFHQWMEQEEGGESADVRNCTERVRRAEAAMWADGEGDGGDGNGGSSSGDGGGGGSSSSGDGGEDGDDSASTARRRRPAFSPLGGSLGDGGVPTTGIVIDLDHYAKADEEDDDCSDAEDESDLSGFVVADDNASFVDSPARNASAVLDLSQSEEEDEEDEEVDEEGNDEDGLDDDDEGEAEEVELSWLQDVEVDDVTALGSPSLLQRKQCEEEEDVFEESDDFDDIVSRPRTMRIYSSDEEEEGDEDLAAEGEGGIAMDAGDEDLAAEGEEVGIAMNAEADDDMEEEVDDLDASRGLMDFLVDALDDLSDDDVEDPLQQEAEAEASDPLHEEAAVAVATESDEPLVLPSDCGLSQADVSAYNDHVAAARKWEQQRDLQHAAQSYLLALSVWDGDEALHRTLFHLSRRLQSLST